MTSETEDWEAAALCAQTDPELFYPEKDRGKNSAREAKQVCMACEVRVQCLEFALRTGQDFGVWGGLSERQRRNLRAERRAAA